MENHVGVAPLALGQVTLNSRNLTGGVEFYLECLFRR